jgi:hypothetical protein
VAKEESSSAKQSTHKIKLTLLAIFILVLCLLGLALIKNSYATTKDVVPQFSGNAASSGSVSFVTYTVEGHHGHGTFNATVVNGVYLVPIGLDYTVSWMANADIYNYAPQQSGEDEFDGSDGSSVQTPVISVNYTVQVA